MAIFSKDDVRSTGEFSNCIKWLFLVRVMSVSCYPAVLGSGSPEL